MSRDPRTLLDDPELPSAQRDLLVAGRALVPARYDVDRGALRFRAALDAAAAGGAATAAAGTAARLSSASKLALVTMASVLALGSYIALQGDAEPRERNAAARATPPAQVRSVAVATETEVQAANSPSAVPAGATAVHEDAPPRTRSIRQPSTSPRKLVHSTALVPVATEDTASMPASNVEQEATDSSAQAAPEASDATRGDANQSATPAPAIDELHAIVRARALLTRDPASALAMLEQLERRQPNGNLVEERAALIVLALAALDRESAAQRRGQAFLQAFPHSPYAARVRSALAPR